jgi:arabinose-5-phosphate isomerase
MRIFKIAKETLEIESRAIMNQIEHLDSNFYEAVSLVKNCKGHVVVMGLGKSGLIGRKVSATMSSVGIPSMFLHPVDGLHGDIGMLMKHDIVITLSYSGGTPEIEGNLLILRKMKIKVIAMTGRVKAQMWQNCDCVVNCSVEKEACPYDLAPTSSTSAMLALGDALAITVSILKGFTKEKLAFLHPLGVIGKRLTMSVGDIIKKGAPNPVVKQTSTIEDAIFVMTSTRLGATSIVDDEGIIVGFFTDGDLRRYIQNNNHKTLSGSMVSFMTKNPKVVTPDVLAVEAAKILNKYSIDNIPVVDGHKKPLGVLDQRDLLAEGII